MDKLKRAYEWARLQQALIQSAVLGVPVAGLVLLSPRRALAVALGLSLLATATALWWRGELFGRGVLRGAVAGLVPFAFASVAMQCGPGCDMGGHCVPWCVPACAAGGVVAAWMIARAAPPAPQFWLSAGAITSLTGALGCSCYSLTGTAALMVAFVCVSAPAYAFRARG